MNHFDVLMTLVSDVSVPQNGATLSGRASLHYLPGSSLRGALAAKMYSEDEDAAFSHFHTHQVQFGHAYPARLLDDEGSWSVASPWPLSFKAPKPRQASDPAYRNTAINAPTSQHKVERAPLWLLPAADGKLYRLGVETTGGLRTAVAKDGKASDGLLFQMDAITAGQRFVARVRANDGSVLQRLRQEIDGATLRLGRSRTAEYGQVTCEVLADPVRDTPLEPLTERTTTLYVHLWSDVALVDAYGSPVLAPTPAAFGLSDDIWKWDTRLSEFDTRSYYPWNAAWRRPDAQRTVITAGSVLTFNVKPGQSPVDPAALTAWRDRLHRDGVGLYRYDGLGRVFVQPSWLLHPSLDAVNAPPGPIAAARSTPPASVADLPFMKFASQALSEVARRSTLTRRAVEFALGDGKYLIESRAIPNSQWGQLRYEAQSALRRRTPDTFIASFKKVAEKGVSGVKWSGKHAGVSHFDRVIAFLNVEKDATQRCILAQELATEMSLQNTARGHREQAQPAPEQGGAS